MKWNFYILFFSATFFFQGQFHAQSLKRKFLKLYLGEIPSYEAILGTELIQIPKNTVKINLQKDSLILTIGEVRYAGVYEVMKYQNSKNFEITMMRLHSDIPEKIILDTSKRVLIRKGIYPQPEVILQRQRKSRKR